MKNSLQFIQFVIEQGALQFGQFTLKSGRVSPYFFNAGLFNDGHALEVLSKFYAQAIIESDIKFDMLFGPAYKGIPLVTAVAMTLAREHELNLPYAFNRKETKKYGDGGSTVGAPLLGRVLIVDDVITAGTAITEAVEIIRQSKAIPVGAVIAFDRQERGSTEELSAVESAKQKFDIDVISVSNACDLIEFAESKQLYIEHLSHLNEYFEKYKSKTL